jgi:fibronectin-binding autotransporter adhesin
METMSVWNGGSGDWSTADDWSDDTVPNSPTAQAIVPSGTVTVSASETFAIQDLTIDGDQATVDLAGTLNFLGATNPTINVNNGTLAIIGAGALSGYADVTVGPSGTLDISGATLGSNQAIILNSLDDSGTITLGNNALVIGAEDGSSTLSGTIVTGNSPLGGLIDKVGAGSLTLNNVVMNPGTGNSGLYMTTGALIQSSGNSNIFYLAIGEGTGNAASATLSGGTLTIGTSDPNSGAGLQIGDYGGQGTFQQTGGTLHLVGGLNIGNQGGSGTYEISGGTLSLDNGLYVVGRNSGSNPASTGELDISGTGLVHVVASKIILGDNVSSTAGEGHGTINQTGGTLEVDAGAGLYLAAYGNGTYNLNGGVLEIGGSSLQGVYNAHGGQYALNLGGGTIAVTGSRLVTSDNATLVSGSTSTIDLNNLGASFTGTITGSGDLILSDAGTAAFSSINITGGITLNGNTLDVSGGSTAQIGDISGTGTIALGNATLVLGGNNADSTLSGSITSGSGLINKVGAGSLTLDSVVMSPGTGSSGLYITGGSLLENSGSSSLFYLAVGEGSGNSASATFSGGDLVVGGSASGAFQIGDFGGTGTVTQTAGTITIAAGSLNIGNQGGTGTYNLSGGTLTFDGGVFDIGRNNGTHAPSSGTLSLSGGLVDVEAGQLVLGTQYTPNIAGSSGTIVQTGGVLRIESGVFLYLTGQPGSQGSYKLDSGTLEIGGQSLQPGGGTYSFELGGGEIQVINTLLTTYANATLVDGTTSTVALEGIGASFLGSITGSGDLDLIDGGTASFSNLQTTGAVHLSGGSTLALTNNSSIDDVAVAAGQAGAVSVGTNYTLSLLATAGLSIGLGATLDVSGVVSTAGSIANSGALNLDQAAVSAGALVNNGQITLDPSSLSVSSVAGTGTVTIDTGSTLSVSGAVDSGETIVFTGSGGVLKLGAQSDIVRGTIKNFDTSDELVLTGLAYDSSGTVTLSDSDVLTIVEDGVTLNLQLASDSGYTGLYFHLAQDGDGSSVVVNDQPACFCAGTLIETDRGPVPVEALKAGDRVVTLDGSLLPIRWVGRSTITTRWSDPLRVYPICIRAGSLGPNMPDRDLRTSPCHALLLGDVLVQGNALVNGHSIIRETRLPTQFVYYHIELETHELLIANGIPAESFVDNISRMAFDNWDEHPVGDDRTAIMEMPLPRVKSHRQMPGHLRTMLTRCAAAWAESETQGLRAAG